jgi:DNA-binding MarR family transcriptional regulator
MVGYHPSDTNHQVGTKHLSETQPAYDADDRRRLLRRVMAGHLALMQRLAEGHVPEFLEVDISMPQAKALYLVVAEGGLHMSSLALRLHVTLSTVSGLIDRLAENRLVSRHDDPADRRQVVVSATPEGEALIERFRELNERQLNALLEALDDRELLTVARALEALVRAVASAGSVPVIAAEPVVTASDTPATPTA